MNAKEYLITCAMEECAELAKELAKANRFGLDNRYPVDGPSASEKIAREFADLTAVVRMLEDHGWIANTSSPSAIEAKKKKVAKYMRRSQEAGMLQD